MVGATKKGLSNMEAFDKLPRVVREVLANADHNWSSAKVYDVYKARRVVNYSDASFALGKGAAWGAFIKYHDSKKHNEDAQTNGHICPGQRKG
jgi:hypothetical protein